MNSDSVMTESQGSIRCVVLPLVRKAQNVLCVVYSAVDRLLKPTTFSGPLANGLVRLRFCEYARLARLRISQLICSWDLPYPQPRHAGDTDNGIGIAIQVAVVDR